MPTQPIETSLDGENYGWGKKKKKKKRREAPYLESGRSLARVVLQISSLCGFCMLMPDMWQPSQPLLNTLAD